jgi:hypothetical protein
MLALYGEINGLGEQEWEAMRRSDKLWPMLFIVVFALLGVVTVVWLHPGELLSEYLTMMKEYNAAKSR